DRRGGVELLPDHHRAVPFHLDGDDAGGFLGQVGVLRHPPRRLRFRAVAGRPGRSQVPGAVPGPGRGRRARGGPPPPEPPARARGRGPACSVPCRAALRRSPKRRSRSSSLASARSSAANRSSAAASARMAGPRDKMVSSTRSRWLDRRGLRSAETSTSTLIVLWVSLAILLSFAAA